MTDEHGTLLLPGPGTGCRPGSHDTRPSPDVNPELGRVPAKSSCWFGAVVLVVLLALLDWLLPDTARPWIALVLVLWFLVVLVVQLGLGHRGRCLARRTVRWYLGPIGALADPLDID